MEHRENRKNSVPGAKCWKNEPAARTVSEVIRKPEQDPALSITGDLIHRRSAVMTLQVNVLERGNQKTPRGQLCRSATHGRGGERAQLRWQEVVSWDLRQAEAKLAVLVSGGDGLWRWNESAGRRQMALRRSHSLWLSEALKHAFLYKNQKY